MLTVLLAILCSVFMLAGLAGIILPVLPGVPLAWLGLFIFAIGTGFERISVTTTVVFFVLTLLTLVIDLVAPMLGAKKYRASKLGILGASIGLMVGIIAFGFWGIILGPFLGALLGEMIATGAWDKAFKSATGTLVGFFTGTLLKIVVVLVMLGFFVASWF